jgi:hypothetical protein
LVFGFYAAFVESFLNFFLPGLFYINCYKLAKHKQVNYTFLIISYVYVFIGGALFISMNINNVLKIIAANQ